MKLIDKWILAKALSVPDSWSTFLSYEYEFDSEEDAINLLESLSKNIRKDYYIIKVRRYE